MRHPWPPQRNVNGFPQTSNVPCWSASAVISVCISTIWTKLFPDQVSLPAEASTKCRKELEEGWFRRHPWVAPGLGARAGDRGKPASPPPRGHLEERTSGQGGGAVLEPEHPKWLFSFQKRHGSIMFVIKKKCSDNLSLTVSSCLDPLQITWPQRRVERRQIGRFVNMEAVF